jgi:phenylpropionate dioxygenase-like ring-hydroxylating dioxygenase large terminal subunit
MFLPVDAATPPLRPSSSAIGPHDWDVLARFWYPVALANEVVDVPFKAQLLDVGLVLFRAGGQVTAAVDMCPHRWVRLSAGKLRDGEIVCAFHGLSFNGSGQCTGIPSLGRSAKLPSHYRLRTFRTALRYGMVWVCLSDTSEESIPCYPSVAGAEDSSISFGAVCHWPMSAARQIENFFDLAHLPFIHATTLGGDPFARLEPPSIEQQQDAVIFRAKYVETVPVPKPTEFEFTYRVYLPFAIDFRTEAEGTTRLKSVNIASPTSAYTCRVFQFHVARAQAQTSTTAQNLHSTSGLGVIQQQDIDMLRELVIADLPLNPKLEIHLPVDNVSGAYRKRLQGLGLTGT